ncbi:hypothetical protein C7377_0603 [Balneicella halophila]|uniref:Uncharacterized protein n=1 Tax=Balneicella halophila TaxID=1537566 RepID=A0A7L4URB6_BALHA|nr:hypothetical protein [Balneicella halophila]PVX52293.1 hypothetical protein C7377_0603 [Balneicella halophila]
MKLFASENKFFITNVKPFMPEAISEENIVNSYEFAYQMTFGSGHHRNHRSGGQNNRKNGELFGNTFQGKLAEYVTYNKFKDEGLADIILPDVSVHGRGIWDDTDLEYRGKKINIKSCAFFSNLLLLEQKDWNQDGQYIPNLNNGASKNYDYFVLVRIKPDIKRLLQKEQLLYSNKNEKSKISKIISCNNWYYDFAGVCSRETIKYIIANNYLLPQDALLNGTISMDASNYYIQSGSLKNISVLINTLRNM